MIKVLLSLGSVNRLTTAGIVNNLIWIAIIVILFFISAGITNKIAKTKKTRFIFFIVIMLFLVIAATAVIIPIENRVIHFETPESVFNFTHSEEIVDIVQGDESCMIIYREGDNTLGLTYVLKSGNRYKMPYSFTTKKVYHSLDQNGSFSVNNVSGTNDYYIIGSILTYEDSLTIVNCNGIMVNHIDTEIITDGVKVTDVFLYDVVCEFNEDYYLVINDNVIAF